MLSCCRESNFTAVVIITDNHLAGIESILNDDIVILATVVGDTLVTDYYLLIYALFLT